MSREIVLEQLQILDRLGVDGNLTKVNDGDVTPAKRPKTDVDVASASGSKISTANSLNSATVKKATPIKLTELDHVAVVVIGESDDEIMTEPTKKPVAITATQLQKGLCQATKGNPSVVASTSANTIAPSQADQLAAYRARHIQQKPQQPQTSASASTQSHINSPSIDPCRPTTSAENPHSRPLPKNIEDYISVVNPRGQMAAKLTAAAPYNFFLTTITASLPTHTEPLSITFQGKWRLFYCVRVNRCTTARSPSDPSLEFRHTVRCPVNRLRLTAVRPAICNFDPVHRVSRRTQAALWQRSGQLGRAVHL